MKTRLNNAMLKAYLGIQNFFKKENGGMTIIEIVILIAIVVILAVAFKDAIINLLQNLFEGINSGVSDIASESVSFTGS